MNKIVCGHRAAMFFPVLEAGKHWKMFHWSFWKANHDLNKAINRGWTYASFQTSVFQSVSSSDNYIREAEVVSSPSWGHHWDFSRRSCRWREWPWPPALSGPGTVDSPTLTGTGGGGRRTGHGPPGQTLCPGRRRLDPPYRNEATPSCSNWSPGDRSTQS